MKRHSFILLLGLLLCNISLFAQTNGDYRTTYSGNWNDTGIWEIYYNGDWTATGVYPNYSNNSQITIRSGHSVNLNVSVTVDQMIIESNGGLTISQGFELNLNNGTGDDLVNNGTINWTGVLVISGSTLVNNSGGVLNIQGDTNKSVRYGAGYFNNYGTINWVGTCSLVGGSKVFNNYPGGIIDLKSDAGFYYDYGGDGMYIINNSGLVKKSAGTGISDFYYVQLNNTGSVLVESGTLKLNTSGESSGIFTINSGKTLEISNGSYKLTEGSVVNGAGNLLLSGGAIQAWGTTNGADLGADLTFNMTGGSLEYNGKLNIYGDFNWTAGTITIGTLNIKNGAVFNISGDSNKSLRYGTGYINNNGTITWTGAGNIYGGSKIINNQSDGLFEIKNNAGFYSDNGGDGAFTFNNYGVLKKTNSSENSLFNFMYLNNSGTVQIETGTLRLNTGGSQSGTINVSSGSSLDFIGGTHNMMDNAIFNGPGSYLLSGGNFSVSGTNTGSIFEDNSQLIMSGGSIDNSGKLFFKGIFDWTGGMITASNLTVSSSGTMNISGNNNKSYRYGAGNLYNYGTIVWSGNGNIVGGSKTIHNMESGTFDIQNDCGFSSDFGGDGPFTFNNYGLLKKSSGSGATLFNYMRLTNNGTMQVLTGSFHILNSGQLVNFLSGVLSQGIFEITGTLKFINSGITNCNTTLILIGPNSQILNQDGNNALAGLTTIGSNGTLELRNGRDFTLTTNLQVNGILNCHNQFIIGNANFTLNDNATLMTENVNGICLNGNLGSIQNTGTRSFSQNASYNFNGHEPQLTGTGFPLFVKDLTLDNEQGLTLNTEVTIKSQINLLNGTIHNGSHAVTLGINATNKGNLNQVNGKINGVLKRWISTNEPDPILFPISIGEIYRPVLITFTQPVSVPGIISTEFSGINPGDSGLPLDDAGWIINHISQEGYWKLDAEEGLTGGIYNLALTAKGFSGIGNIQTLRIIRRNSPSENWSVSGLHENGSGTMAEPIAKRTGLSGFSNFTIASGDDSTLPVTLSSFTAVSSNIDFVSIQWQTQSESNLLGYHLYRNSIDQLATSDRVSVSLIQAGNQSNTTTYNFKDEDIEKNQQYFYWLQSVENNGNSQYFGPVHVLTMDTPDIPDLPTITQFTALYPNPVHKNQSVTMEFKVSKDETAVMTIYNIKGQAVKAYRNIPAGVHKLIWDGKDLNNKTCSSGIYFYQLSSPTLSKTGKMIIIR